jgi:acetyltransferase-like isoleucine patch superfamily enzyme
VNSLGLMDHCLLELGAGAVIGSDAHISGHIVEHGVLKTARVRIGARVTIGIGAVVEIGAEIGDGAQVGALSVVPKHARLEPNAVYVGAPVRRLEK